MFGHFRVFCSVGLGLGGFGSVSGVVVVVKLVRYLRGDGRGVLFQSGYLL